EKMTLRLCSPLAAWIFIILIPGLSEGGKLLVVPMVGSHWLSMKEVVQKLAERGHEVVVLKPEVSWHMGEKHKHAYTVKTYPGSTKLEELDDAFKVYLATHLKSKPFPLNILALYNISVDVFSTFFLQCKELFDSTETLQYLNQSGFDAILTDPVLICGATVANYLSLPSVFFMRGFPCNLHYEATECPSPLSYVPRLFSFNSDHMTFFQRVENTLIALLEQFYCNGYYRAAIQLSSEVLQRDVSLIDLLNSASIWLLRYDFVFEYPRPVMPNMVFIGGINCEQKKPLPKVCLFSQITHFPKQCNFMTCGCLVDLVFLFFPKYFNISGSPWSEMETKNIIAPYKNTVHLFNTFYLECRELFNSMETLKYLNQSGFDAVLTDPFFMCGATVANYLSLPFVFFMRGFPCNLHFEAAQCPSPLSYVPRGTTMNSDHMTFFQRVENTLIALVERYHCNAMYQDAIKFSSEVLQRDVSLIDLLNSASIWLLRYDFAFEYPRPVMPNMVFIGGMNCAQKEPLSKVCSFSQVTHFPKQCSFVAYEHLVVLIFFFFPKHFNRLRFVTVFPWSEKEADACGLN
uniref:glucuronosyltransferase n=1 Tax=Coturnix japonica TaxID=93934 RepID=A0A8C2TPW9_COTJA